MSASLTHVDVLQEDTLDMIETVAAGESWSYERITEDEVNLSIPGSWCDFHLILTHHAELEALHMACIFDLKVPAAKKVEVQELLSLINEQLWLGHFDLWSQDGCLMFRHGHILSDGATLNAAQCQSLLYLAVEACERYYPAFQYVIWAGKSPKQALTAVIFETRGCA